MKKLLTLAAFSTLSTSALACGMWFEQEVEVCATKAVTIGYKTRTDCTYIDSRRGEVDQHTNFFIIEYQGSQSCANFTRNEHDEPVWLYERSVDRVAITETVTDYDNCIIETRRVWVPGEDNDNSQPCRPNP